MALALHGNAAAILALYVWRPCREGFLLTSGQILCRQWAPWAFWCNCRSDLAMVDWNLTVIGAAGISFSGTVVAFGKRADLLPDSYPLLLGPDEGSVSLIFRIGHRDDFIHPGSRVPRARTVMVRIWLIGLQLVQREVGRLSLRRGKGFKHVHICMYIHTYTHRLGVLAYMKVIDKGGFPS